MNLWQSAVETILFFHPAVWWASRIIKVERELCCDDMVVSMLGDGATYARALATLEEMRSRPLALAATDGELLARMRRILSREGPNRANRPSALLSLAMAAPLAIALMVSGTGYYSRAATHNQAAKTGPITGASMLSLPPDSNPITSTRSLSPHKWAGEATADGDVSQLPAGEYASEGAAAQIGRATSFTVSPRTAESLAVVYPMRRAAPGTELRPAVLPHTTSNQGVEHLDFSQAPPLQPVKESPNAARDRQPGAGRDGDMPALNGPVIGEIVVTGNNILGKNAIIALSGHKVGDPCTIEVLSAMRDKLAKSGHFGTDNPAQPDQAVRLQAEDIGGGKRRVTISVDENDRGTGIVGVPNGPTIGEFVVKGNNVLNSQAIVALGMHKIGDPCTPEILTDIHDRLARSGYFGMHHPDQRQEWAKVQAEAIGDNKCKVTITVDENDKITGVLMTGSGPVKPEEVKSLINPSAVYNPQQIAQDAQSIINLYNRRGYSVTFGNAMGMDKENPGTLVVPIFVTRVGTIMIRKDGAIITDAKLLARLVTKRGGYFNRKAFYEKDRPKLLSTKGYEDVFFSERSASPGVVDLDISIKTKKR